MATEFAYGGSTILSHPLVVEIILPFLLVFTIVFAILQKSEVLGKGKKQIDAIVSLVIGLIVISFANAVGIILQLIPFLAVSLVIILVLMILIGSFHSGDKKFEIPTKLKYVLWAVAIVAVVIAVLVITQGWQYILALLFLTGNSTTASSVIFIIIIIGAIAFVMWGGGKGSSGSSEK